LKIGILASPATSLQTCAKDIKRSFEKVGYEPLVFNRRVPWFQAEKMYRRAVFHMTFDPLYAKSWFLACRDYNKFEIPSFVYVTTEGLPKPHLISEWLKEEVPYVAVSKFVAKQLRRIGVSVMDVVHHGLNLDDIRIAEAGCEGERARLKRLLHDKTVFGVVAGGHGRKGLSLLTKVIEKVNRRSSEIGFYILTNREGRAYFHKPPSTYIDAGFGNKERIEVLSLIASFDFLLHPALIEGFGMVLLEAMGLGKPCIHVDFEPLTEFSPAELNYVVEPVELVENDFGDGIYYPCHIYEPDTMAQAILDAHSLLKEKRDEYQAISEKFKQHAKGWDSHKPYLQLLRHLGLDAAKATTI